MSGRSYGPEGRREHRLRTRIDRLTEERDEALRERDEARAETAKLRHELAEIGRCSFCGRRKGREHSDLRETG